MLAVIGVGSLDEMAAKALPAGILDALNSQGVAPGLETLPAPATARDVEALTRQRLSQGVLCTFRGLTFALRPARCRREVNRHFGAGVAAGRTRAAFAAQRTI